MSHRKHWLGDRIILSLSRTASASLSAIAIEPSCARLRVNEIPELHGVAQAVRQHAIYRCPLCPLQRGLNLSVSNFARGPCDSKRGGIFHRRRGLSLFGLDPCSSQ